MARGSKGWHKVAPKTKAERAKLLAKCFLGPDRTYPICAKGSTKVDCRGVIAARSRARALHHEKIAKKAERKMRSCAWR